MHSSISSSSLGAKDIEATAPKPTSAHIGIVVLLAGLVGIFVALETGSSWALRHLSRTERRITTELNAARHIPPRAADGRPTVLLVGNSLLIEGVQMDGLQQGLASEYAVSRYAIERTAYYDWYFGLSRLLEEGSRPSMIVMILAPDQVSSNLTLGESFAYREVSTHDLPKMVQETHLDKNVASSYMLAHWSRWQANKEFIRQCIMILLVPRFRQLAGRIADRGPHLTDPDLILNRARERLPKLQEMTRAYGIPIVLLIPPALREDHSAELQKTAASVGFPVWVPSYPGELSRDYFRDNLHLNPKGASLFTSRLVQQLHEYRTVLAGCPDCDPAR